VGVWVGGWVGGCESPRRRRLAWWAVGARQKKPCRRRMHETNLGLDGRSELKYGEGCLEMNPHLCEYLSAKLGYNIMPTDCMAVRLKDL